MLTRTIKSVYDPGSCGLVTGSSAHHLISSSLSNGSSVRQSTWPLLKANLSQVARRLVSRLLGHCQVAGQLIGRFQVAHRLDSLFQMPSEVSGPPKVIIIMSNWNGALETPIPSLIFIRLPLKYMHFQKHFWCFQKSQRYWDKVGQYFI